MRTFMGGMALAAVVALTVPSEGLAQRGPRGDRGPGFAERGQGVEMIMRLRSELELTDEQVERFDAIRQEAVERRTAHQAQMEELRSQVRAGEMTQQEMREIAQARREGAEEVRQQEQERIDAVLTETQRQELETLRAQRRGFAMGRASAMRGARGQAGRGEGCAMGRAPHAGFRQGGPAGPGGPGGAMGPRGPGAGPPPAPGPGGPGR